MARKRLVYNTNREWQKDIKFNNHWYHLKALFDRDQDNQYDFNKILPKVGPLKYAWNGAAHTNGVKYDFNTVDINDAVGDTYDEKYDFNKESLDEFVIMDDMPVNSEHEPLINILKEFAKEAMKVQWNVRCDLVYYSSDPIGGTLPFDKVPINKNIAGHTIEDFIIKMLKLNLDNSNENIEIHGNKSKWSKEEEEELSAYGLDVSTMYRNKEKLLKDTTTYDIAIKYNNVLYYVEVKSAESNTIDFRRDNIRIGDNQMVNRPNLIFIMVNYDIKQDNTIHIGYIKVVDGAQIAKNREEAKKRRNSLPQ